MCNSHHCLYIPLQSLNKHPLINKHITGVSLWAVDILFRYFEQQGDNNSLSDKQLTQKLLILLLLLYAYRISTVKLFSVSNMVLNDLSVTFIPTEVLKHSRKGKPFDKFECRSYTDNKLCIISCLWEYPTSRDKHLGLSTDQLIITLKKPFRGASIDTMRRWVKNIFTRNDAVDLFSSLLPGNLNK